MGTNLNPIFTNADYYINTSTSKQYDTCEEALKEGASLNEVQAVHSILLISETHGIHIPQIFAKRFSLKDWHLTDSLDDMAILEKGADDRNYWEAWEDVLKDAYYIDHAGNKWILEQDGSLFTKLYIEGETYGH